MVQRRKVARRRRTGGYIHRKKAKNYVKLQFPCLYVKVSNRRKKR